MLVRRALLVLVAALAAAPALAAGPVAADMSLGNPRARVTVTEYASLTCPHCAHFHADVFPAFKKKYVDTGKVRYVLKEFVTPPTPVAVAGWMIARCSGPANYFAVVDGIFRSQARWTADNVNAILAEVAQAKGGLSRAQVDACLADQAALASLRTRVTKAMDVDKVDSTPSFFVNGKLVRAGVMSLQDLDAAIAAAAKGGR